jgi:error-prone DNA polymerase
VGSPKEWAETAVERGYTALAVADVDGLYGAVEFVKAAAAAGLHAIVGATLTLDRDSHCVVLAPDDRAYRQLCRLLSARNLLPNFTLEQVAADLDALLFLARSGGVLRRLARYVAPENLYALAPTDAPSGQPLLWDQVPHTCRRAYVPDAWFLQAEDRVPFDYLRQLRTGTQGRDSLVPWHVGAVLPEAREWARQFPDRRAADELSERCRFRFPFGTVHLPRISLPRQMDAGEYLATLCRLGLDARYATDRRAPAEARLNKELRIIGDSGYADYFLFVNEIFEFARRKRIPCTVRGSAASSIVGHLLGFTDCCPLANGLLFERFMSSARRDCPDIDIDIADFRRDEVIDYCYDHWGREHVAMASAIQFYRARGALRDAGRLLRLPTERISALIEAPDGDRQCPDLYRIAAHLVGRPRHLSVHCAGLIITPVPIRDLTPLAMTAKGIQLTHYDKDQAEAVGLLKIDLLGSSALSVIAEAKEWLVKAGRDWRDAGPIWDYKVNRLFAAGDTLGLHQCESPGMRQLCQAVRPRNQREVAMTLSLIRPGPASSGMKDTFVRRRRGLEEVSHIHPRMAELVGGT